MEHEISDDGGYHYQAGIRNDGPYDVTSLGDEEYWSFVTNVRNVVISIDSAGNILKHAYGEKVWSHL